MNVQYASSFHLILVALCPKVLLSVQFTLINKISNHFFKFSDSLRLISLQQKAEERFEVRQV